MAISRLQPSGAMLLLLLLLALDVACAMVATTPSRIKSTAKFKVAEELSRKLAAATSDSAGASPGPARRSRQVISRRFLRA